MATLVRELPSSIQTATADLAAADSSKTVIAAPAAGVRLRIFRTVYISKTSAAQALALAVGTTNILDLAASVTAHAVVDTGWMDGGILCPAATALVATPAAAGPAGKFIVVYSSE